MDIKKINEDLTKIIEYWDDDLDEVVEYRVVFTDGTEDTSFNTLNGHPFYDDYEIVCTEPDPENAMIWYAETKLGKEVEYIEKIDG